MKFLGALLLAVPFAAHGAITYIGVGTAVHTDNASATPTLHASTTTGDLVLCFVPHRTGNASPASTGYSALVNFGLNNETVLLAKVAGASEGSPTITVTGDATDTVSAQCATFRGTLNTVTGIVAHSSTTTNASQQDIDTPALTVSTANTLVLVFGRKSDDSTSVAQLSGMTEIVQQSTTTGGDQTMAVDYVIQTTAANITAGALTVTGGGTAGGGAMVVSIKPAAANPPAFTAGPTLGTMTASTAPTTFTTDLAATVYGVACPNGQTAPTVAQTKAGNCTGNIAAVNAWSEVTVATVSDAHTFTGLAAATIYDLSFVASSAGGDSSLAALANATTSAAGCGGTPTVTSVSADDVLTATETAFSVVGTNFCATQSTGSLVFRDAASNDKTITCSSWAATLLSSCNVSGVGMGIASALKYGALTARVTNSDASTGTRAITVNAPSGTKYADLTSLVAISWDNYGSPSRPYGTPNDLQATSQLAMRNATGCTIATDLTINADGSLALSENCLTADFDYTRDGLYVGTVETMTFRGLPPTFGNNMIPSQVYARNLAIIPYDLDDYFVLGEAALTNYTIKQLTTPTTVTFTNAAGSGLILPMASLTGLAVGDWLRVGITQYSRVKYLDPFNVEAGLWYPITWEDGDTVSTMALGTCSITGLSIDGSTHVFGGTPTTVESNPLCVFRLTDTGGQTADSP